MQSKGCVPHVWCSPLSVQFAPMPHVHQPTLLSRLGGPGDHGTAIPWTAANVVASKPAGENGTPTHTSLQTFPRAATVWSSSRVVSSAPCPSTRPRAFSSSNVSTAAPSETSFASDAASDAGALGTSFAASAGASIQVTPAPEALIGCRLTAGSYSCQGRKTLLPGWPNQDVPLVVSLTPDLLLAAVFDGHGRDGHRSASCVRALFEQRARHLATQTGEALFEAFRQTFRAAQDTLVREGLAHYSGATATVTLIDAGAGRVTVAHVGDSTLAIMRGPVVASATRDHRVDDIAERRVLQHGGEVRVGRVGTVETRRIYARGSDFPGLAMARALGDQEAQRLGASCEPEFTTFAFDPASDNVVVASDGLWDVLSHNAVAARLTALAAGGGLSERDLASCLVNEARQRYPCHGDIDDITAIVVKTSP